MAVAFRPSHLDSTKPSTSAFFAVTAPLCLQSSFALRAASPTPSLQLYLTTWVLCSSHSWAGSVSCSWLFGPGTSSDFLHYHDISHNQICIHDQDYFLSFQLLHKFLSLDGILLLGSNDDGSFRQLGYCSVDSVPVLSHDVYCSTLQLYMTGVVGVGVLRVCDSNHDVIVAAALPVYQFLQVCRCGVWHGHRIPIH